MEKFTRRDIRDNVTVRWAIEYLNKIIIVDIHHLYQRDVLLIDILLSLSNFPEIYAQYERREYLPSITFD